MESLQEGVDRLLEVIFEWLPQLLGALLIVLVGHFVAKTLSNLLERGLNKVKLDKRLSAGQGGNVIQRAVPRPTHLVERVAYWLVFLGALALAASVLGIDALDRLVASIYGYVPEVVAAILIFMVGSAVAAGVGTLVRNTMGDSATGRMLETILPVVVMGITVFAILDQLEIAPVIVTITYATLMGAVGLGSALAFGLGGRDVAARVLEASYEKGRSSDAKNRVGSRARR